MKELLEQGYGVLFVGIVAGIGGLARIFLIGYYGKLEKACRTFGQAKNKTISYIREDLAFRLRNNIGMKSVTVYTECRLAESRVCGLRLGTLEGITQQSLLLVVLSGVLLAFAGILWNCEGRQILFLLFAGGVSFFGLLVLDLFTGLQERHKRIRLVIRDFIENGERMERDTVSKVVREKKARSRNMTGKAQEEKRRLTEELLRERRQMEARGLAESRKKETVLSESEEEKFTEQIIQEVKTEVLKPEKEEAKEIIEHVTEEAAATRFSYEDLLSDVLAEYLA